MIELCLFKVWRKINKYSTVLGYVIDKGIRISGQNLERFWKTDCIFFTLHIYSV